MQKIARELNLSETVFVLPAESDGDVRLRIFTPVSELPFAGPPRSGLGVRDRRPALGGHGASGRRSGAVPVALEREGDRIVFGRMQQPIPTWRPYERAVELLAALGVERSELPVEGYQNRGRCTSSSRSMSEARGRCARARHRRARRASGRRCQLLRGLGPSWKMRMFAPAHGVHEDPATGSAAGPLAVHLARHGRIAFGDRSRSGRV